MSVPSDSSSSGGVMGAVRMFQQSLYHIRICLYFRLVKKPGVFLRPTPVLRGLACWITGRQRVENVNYSNAYGPASLLAESDPRSFLILVSVKCLTTTAEGTGGCNARTRLPPFCRLSTCQRGWPRGWLSTSSTCCRPSALLRTSTLATR